MSLPLTRSDPMQNQSLISNSSGLDYIYKEHILQEPENNFFVKNEISISYMYPNHYYTSFILSI